MKKQQIVPSLSNLLIVFGGIYHFSGHICVALAVVSGLVYLRPYDSFTDKKLLKKVRSKITLLYKKCVQKLNTKTIK